jgi:cell division transport system permease protein
MSQRRQSPPRQSLFRQPFTQGRTFRERLDAYVSLQIYSLKASFARIWETPIASSLTIFVVAIALALPASFSALVENVRQPLDALDTTSQISLFLKPELSNEAARKLSERLRKNPRLTGATLVTKEDGLRELMTFSGFENALAALSSNPLPAVIILRPVDTDTASVTELLDELRTLPESDRVQFDDEWLQKLRALLAITERCALAFSVLLGLGVLFIVGNTIRLELQNRREEIIVSKILGATNSFIRRPFMHSGFWYAFLGAVLALIVSNLLILDIKQPADALATLYDSPYRLSFLSFKSTCLLLGCAIFLGIMGAWIVVGRFLREIDPS